MASKSFPDDGNIVVYTDGGSRGNPGESAIGVVIKNSKGETLKKYGESIGIATNNQAEYGAVVYALKKLKLLFGKNKTKNMSVEIRMDSKLVSEQLSGNFKIENTNLYQPFIDIWNLKINYKCVEFRYVPREENKEADKLVNEALNSAQQEALL